MASDGRKALRKSAANVLQLFFKVWSGYLELGVALVTSSALQPERCAVRGPDRTRMRADAGLQVLAVWSRLGKFYDVNINVQWVCGRK